MDTPVYGRLRIGGRLFDETHWSIGLAACTPTGTDPFATVNVDVEATIRDWADRVKGLNAGAIFPGAISTLMSQRSTIEYVRTSRVNEQGKETYVALIDIGEPIRGGGSAFLPAQSALVASLLSGRPGASNRGRIYWPALSTNITAAGRVPTPITDGIASATATWVEAAASALYPGLNQQLVNVPAVVSRRTGRLVRITGVRVGNRLDSQRRRSEAQKEAYSTSAVPQQ